MLTSVNRSCFSFLIILIVLAPLARAADQNDESIALTDDYSGDYLVNLNLRFMDLFDNHLDLSLYVLNALDNEARLQALDNWHAWWSYDRGRSIGTKASWKF